MGAITSLLKGMVYKNYTMQDFDRDIKRFVSGGGPTKSGVVVNEQSALRHITVYSCAQVLSEVMATMPIVVFRTMPNGARVAQREHRLYDRLHTNPNDEMTVPSWIETKQGHLVLSGNTYSKITHNQRGQVIDLYPIDWSIVTPERNKDTGRLQYRVNDRGKDEVFPADKILHIPGWGFDGIRGYSRIHMAREAIGRGLAQSEFASRFFSQGMNMGLVFEHPGVLDEDAYNRLKSSLEERGGGMEQSWRAFIVEEGLKMTRIPMPLKDVQFIESEKLGRDEICGLFRVPPHMVANLEKATFSNIEHLSIEFTMFTMLPYVVKYEKAMNWKLFTPQEREQGYYIKFNVAALLRGDSKSRAEALHIMRQDGVINADEWRELEDMAPQPNGMGKRYLINGNMRDVEEVGKGVI